MGGNSKKKKNKPNTPKKNKQQEKFRIITENESSSKSSCENDTESASSEPEVSMEIIPETPLASQTPSVRNKNNSNQNVNSIVSLMASGTNTESGILSSLSTLSTPCPQTLYQLESQTESDLSSFKNSFPPLPSQSP